MASVFEKNGVYYLRYKDERGRWRGIKSAATTKREARRLADDKERLCERVRLGVEQGGGVTAEPSLRSRLPLIDREPPIGLSSVLQAVPDADCPPPFRT